jgi:hypothetical protein
MAEACPHLRKTALLAIVLQLLVDSTGISGCITHYELNAQLKCKHVLNGASLILYLRFSWWLLKNTAFWDVMPLCCLFLAGFLLCLLFNPEIGGNMFLQNLNELLLDYMKLHPRT